MAAATLTYHAELRLAQRTRLTVAQLIQLIDGNMTHIVGCRPQPPHAHHLFFSVKDLDHFVAVQDISTGEVITVLPLDFHANLAWKIGKQHLQSAMLKSAPDFYYEVYPDRKPREAITPKVDQAEIAAAPVGYKMEIIGIFSSLPQKRNLGEYRFHQPPTNGTEAMEDPGFAAKVLAQLSRKGRSPSDLEEILLYHSKTDALLKVPWFLAFDPPIAADLIDRDYSSPHSNPSQPPQAPPSSDGRLP